MKSDKPSQSAPPNSAGPEPTSRINAPVDRRSFLKNTAIAGAGTVGAGLLAAAPKAFADPSHSGITRGDAAILRFLAAAEILETDMWQQYNELAGVQDEEVPGGSGIAVFTARRRARSRSAA